MFRRHIVTFPFNPVPTLLTATPEPVRTAPPEPIPRPGPRPHPPLRHPTSQLSHLPTLTLDNPLRPQTRKHSAQNRWEIRHQTDWFRVELFQGWDDIFVHPVAVLQSPGNHTGNGIWYEDRYVVVGVYPGGVVCWGAVVSGREWVGADEVYGQHVGRAAERNEGQGKKEWAVFWTGWRVLWGGEVGEGLWGVWEGVRGDYRTRTPYVPGVSIKHTKMVTKWTTYTKISSFTSLDSLRLTWINP